MLHFFKSKFFIVLLIVSIVLVIVPSVLSIMGLSSYVRSAVGVVVSPFVRVFDYVSDSIHGFTDYFTEFDRLRDENEELKDRISRMEDDIYNAKLLEAENQWLYGFLDLRRTHDDFSLKEATVTSRQAVNYLTSFTLDCGSMSGIEKDMPVITADGIVGYVSEVGATWCKVSSIVETSVSVGGYSDRSGVVGVIEGEFALRDNFRCRMKYIDADADIKVGDRILSSGLGEVYPRGLSIGTVESIELDPASRTKTAIIKPSVDPDSIDKVMIIKDYTVYTE
ncbi:MAG: rod shape-determining protein MreC [Clostridia bacterium]|nr:rod shape-determining protein MreC [Clostridia bacterium]